MIISFKKRKQGKLYWNHFPKMFGLNTPKLSKISKHWKILSALGKVQIFQAKGVRWMFK